MPRGKCEEVIEENLKGRMKDISKALRLAEKYPNGFMMDGDRYEGLIEWLDSYALALSRTIVYKLELSWGGPQDYFTFECDKDGELGEIVYHYLDWFDGATREIKSSSDDWQILENLFHACIYGL